MTQTSPSDLNAEHGEDFGPSKTDAVRLTVVVVPGVALSRLDQEWA